LPAARASAQVWNTTELVTGTVVGVGSVRVGVGSVGFDGGDVGSEVGADVGTDVGADVDADVGRSVAPDDGVECGVGAVLDSVGRGLADLVGNRVSGGDVGRSALLVGAEVPKNGAVPAVSSPPSNGFTRTSAISASGTPAIAPTLTRLGPPYRPTGPRTGRPASSTQNDHPRGAGGQDSGGRQRLPGRQRTVGGSGQPGGALNCLTLPPPVPAEA
jgi:hypothetical protein